MKFGKSASMIRLLRAASPFTAAKQSEAEGEAIEPVLEEAVVPDDDAAAAASEDRDGADDAVDLDAGIASIFASIRSGSANEGMPKDLPEENGATYALLSELDRLWQNA